MATPTACKSKGFFYFMYRIEMKFRFTNDEQSCLYNLLQKLKEDVNLRKKCDSAVLIPFFERFIDESTDAKILDPFDKIKL